MNFLQHLALEEKKLDDSSHLHVVEIAHVTWNASFQPLKQEKTCNSAHEQTPLSNDTINSVLWQREVGRAKDLSAPPIFLCTGDGQNNGISIPYRNNTVCVGCIERTLVLSIFFFLHYVVPVAMHYILCSITVHMKVPQNGRLVRFLKRTVWCMFSWNICNQNGHFIGCMHSSHFQGYDSIHKSCEDITS